MTAGAGDPRGGVLLVDKPAGVTSFAVVNAVRRALVRDFPELAADRKKVPGGPRPPRFKCGHAGTLDPLATGLLVVLVGKTSRLSNFLLGLDKTYCATVRFGAATDSLDADGEVTATGPLPRDEQEIIRALAGFRGEISQVPPVISALKRDGQPLYKLARAGKDVREPDARPVTIHRLDLTDARLAGETAEVDLLVGCSSGTYIRSLARDLAEAVGTVGHITQLRRLDIGPFIIDEAVSGIMEMDGAAMARYLLPAAEALPHVPYLELTAQEADGIREGHQPGREWLDRLASPPVGTAKTGRLFRMVDAAGELVGVGRVDESTGEPRIAVGIPKQE